MPILRMTDLDLGGKRVLVREDLNVPIDDAGRITSEQRITAALPTLRRLLDQGAAVMVMSHRGRPVEGEFGEADSLAPVAARLGGLLGIDVPLVRDWVGGVPVAPGQLVLLENCRMNVGEKKDAPELAKSYAALCDVFVMDAFGTAHRAQASTHGVIAAADVACGGPLLMAELDALGKALDAPARPLLAIVALASMAGLRARMTALEQQLARRSPARDPAPAPSSAATRQHTPASPWLSITLQKMSQRMEPG